LNQSIGIIEIPIPQDGTRVTLNHTLNNVTLNLFQWLFYGLLQSLKKSGKAGINKKIPKSPKFLNHLNFRHSGVFGIYYMGFSGGFPLNTLFS